MQPVYVRKADPKDRVTWMDKFIAQEPKGGFRDVVELARDGRSKAIFTAILAIQPEVGKAAA
jgi:hypothetical protein